MEMSYEGPEKRKYTRAKGTFIVSYRVLEEENNIDVTQTKDLSLGGMYLTTSRFFKIGTQLAIEIRLPFDPHPIQLVGRVVNSRVITKDLIYDTRLEFLQVDEHHKKSISNTVEHYIKKGQPK
ncbi:MAG: PilZ domain-containing protein [Candidatus Omnitrophota bacterium]